MGVPVPVGRVAVVCLLLASLILAPSKVVAGAFALGTDPVPALRTTRSLTEAHDILEAGLTDSGGKLLLLSRTNLIRPLLLPLLEGGRLRECVIVIPVDNALTDSDRLRLTDALRQDGVSREDIARFSIDNGVLRGGIGGMTLAFVPLSRLPQSKSPWAVAIESAYFQDMHNEIRHPATTLARRLLLTFRERKLAATTLVLIDAMGQPDYPLEDGYLVGLFRDMFSAPDRFVERLPPKWENFAMAEMARFFAQYPEALRHYKLFLDEGGEDPSTCIKIAKMAIRDLDVPFSLQWINRAASSDPSYRRAYAEIAEYLYGKDLFEPAERVIRAGLAKFPKDPVLATGLASFHIARGQASRDTNDPEAAEENFRSAIAVEGADPQVIEKAKEMLKAPPPTDG